MAFNKKEYCKIYSRQWRLNNKERKRKQNEEYRKKHQEYFENYRKTHKTSKQYTYSKKSRASNLLYSYNRSDIQHNRGKGDLTSDWIVENIFTKPCVHCGETDWHKLGCNRLDNTKPHTMDNVEPCCTKCNRSLKRKKGDH